MSESSTPSSSAHAPFEVARLGAFVDAVVAIAMTLLILPLMDSVSDVASGGEDTARWFAEHDSQLVSFLVSFTLIAMFWMIHHRIFVLVEHATPALVWVTMAWLLSIVWLPVATAISGQMADSDLLAKVVYIGSLILTCLCSMLIRLYLRAHPTLHTMPRTAIAIGISVDAATATLFALSLAIALAFPQLGYLPLLLMLFGGPVQSAFARLAVKRQR